MYRLMLDNISFCFYSSSFDFLVQKVEFFYTFRNGVRSKPKIICCKTGCVLYD